MMTDAEYEYRVKAIEWMISFMGDPGSVLRNKRVAEIGSGFGVGAIACLRNGAAQYVGIEPEPFGSRVMQLEDYDPGYRMCYERAAKNIDRRKAIFVEGFADDWPAGGFDIILIADVLEHVEDLRPIVASAFRLLKAGGNIIASTAPLYYSASGHHLFDALKEKPWGHLYQDFPHENILSLASPYIASEFETLNKVTHADICRAFSTGGFVMKQQRTIPCDLPFEEYRQLVDARHLGSVNEDAFTQNVSQIVAQKPPKRPRLPNLPKLWR